MENKKVTLQELADVISAQSGATKRFTDSFLRELVVVIQEYLEKDGIVKVKGLGTFKLLWIEARKSVNVATKETIILPAHYKLSFSPEESIKQELNAVDGIVSGGASIIQDAENEAEPIETEIEASAQVVEKVVEPATEPVVEVAETAGEPVVEPIVEPAVAEPAPAPAPAAKKSHKALISIIIILLIVILGLAAYIFVPNIEGKLMSMFTTIKQSSFEVVSVPSDSAAVEEAVVDTIALEEPVVGSQVQEVVNEPIVAEPVQEELPAEPMITVDNYTPSVAKNAPTREVVTVIDGSRLTMVAFRAYGHKAFWVYVYDANRDRLKRPSDVEKGMELRIADLPKSLVNSKDQRCLDKAYELARKYDK